MQRVKRATQIRALILRDLVCCKGLTYRAIAQHEAGISKKLAVTGDKVMAELAKVGFFNVQDLYDDTGKLLPIKDLAPEVAAAISSVEIDKGFTKVRTSSKLDALTTMAKVLGMVKQEQAQVAIQTIIVQDKPEIAPSVEVRQLTAPEW